jgi:hypothetical protein
MNRLGLLAFVVAVVLTLAVTSAGAGSQPTIDARLEVRVEPRSATTRVEGRVRWTNRGGGPVSELCLVFPGPLWVAASDVDGPMVEDLRVVNGDGISLAASSPAAGVVRVSLGQPVAPATSTVLDASWRAPARAVGRGGDGAAWAVGGTSPRVVVPADGDGECDPRAEAQRGRFRLLVDVPTGWWVVATGSDVGRQQRDGTDGTRDRTVWAVDSLDRVGWVVVHEDDRVVVEGDFDPLEVPSELVAAAAASLGRPPVELQLPPVHLRVIARPDHARRAERLVEELRTTLAWFGLAYGGYPWPQLDVVLLEDGHDDAGTSVAPTLAVVTAPGPEGRFDPTGGTLRRLAASVVAAETFRSVVRFDGSAPEWLPAGLERFAVSSYLASRSQRPGDVEEAVVGEWARRRLELAMGDVRPSSAGAHDGALLTAMMLRSLERRLGRDAVARGLRVLVDADRLGGTSYAALRDALSAAAGEPIGPLLDEVVLERRPPDWTVRRVVSTVAPGSGGGYLTTVDLSRSHTADLPVVVRLELADGSHERRRWEGGETTVRWTVVTAARVLAVEIDPDVEWPVEIRRADNGWQAATPWWRRLRPPWLAPGLHVMGLLTWPWS